MIISRKFYLLYSLAHGELCWQYICCCIAIYLKVSATFATFMWQKEDWHYACPLHLIQNLNCCCSFAYHVSLGGCWLWLPITFAVIWRPLPPIKLPIFCSHTMCHEEGRILAGPYGCQCICWNFNYLSTTDFTPANELVASFNAQPLHFLHVLIAAPYIQKMLPEGVELGFYT